MDPIYCRKCRSLIDPSLTQCPGCGWNQSKPYQQPSKLSKSKDLFGVSTWSRAKKAQWTLFCSAWVVLSIGFWGCVITTQNKPSATIEQCQAESDKLGKAIAASGATTEFVSPSSIRVTLPHDLAMEATSRQLNEMGITFKAIAPDCLIWIKTPAGQTLATVDSFGVHVSDR